MRNTRVRSSLCCGARSRRRRTAPRRSASWVLFPSSRFEAEPSLALLAPLRCSLALPPSLYGWGMPPIPHGPQRWTVCDTWTLPICSRVRGALCGTLAHAEPESSCRDAPRRRASMQREGPRRATRCEILEGAERSEHGGSRCVVARRGSSPSAERSEHGGSRRVVARRGSSPIPRVPRGGRRATGGARECASVGREGEHHDALRGQADLQGLAG